MLVASNRLLFCLVDRTTSAHLKSSSNSMSKVYRAIDTEKVCTQAQGRESDLHLKE
jgi:hypothetical protein